jgi:hypothetical protein
LEDLQLILFANMIYQLYSRLLVLVEKPVLASQYLMRFLDDARISHVMARTRPYLGSNKFGLLVGIPLVDSIVKESKLSMLQCYIQFSLAATQEVAHVLAN